MKEILCISHKYPPTIGGMEKQSFELVTGLEQAFIVHKILYKENDGSKIIWFATLKRRIKKVLANHPSIELIHLNDGLMSAACLWLLKYTEIPVVATIHGLDITFPNKLFQNKIVPRMAGLAATISVSQATREQCVKRGFPEDLSYVVANGVDHNLALIPQDSTVLFDLLEAQGFNPRGKRILVTMGRPVKRKGFSWFANQVVPLLEEDVIFVMVGPMQMHAKKGEKLFALLPSAMRRSLELMLGLPSDQKDLRAALSQSTTSKKVVHLGKLPFAQLMAVVGAADLFVMPNISVEGDAEGFGLVALEASLRGIPVIASGIEGITEAVKQEGNGILLESGNAEQWANEITALLNNKSRFEELSKKTISYTMENYSWSKMAAGYVEVFEKIMSKQE